MEKQTENPTSQPSPCGREPSGEWSPGGPNPSGDEPPVTNQKSPITNHQSPIRSRSTGPRTAQGKRRSSQNALKHGLYSNAAFFWDSAIALGEDPRDFERLLKGLVLARQPANALEMVLVEDIALLIWKKARLDRAEAAVQVCNLYNNYFKLAKLQPGSQEFEDAKTLMRARVAEEIADVAQQYELYLHEYVENTRAARVAATAPSHAQWAAIIRQQNALHRQLEHKIRLPDEMQEKRKKEEERFLDDYRASLQRNPSGRRHGGGGSPSFTRSPGRESVGSARQPVAAPKAGSKGRRHRQNATPRGGGGESQSEGRTKAPRHQAMQNENRFCSLRPLRPLRLGVNPAFPPSQRRNLSANPMAKPQRIVRKLERNLDKRGHTRNRKKILNRGNELEVLLQTKGLTEITPSKRTPFCGQKAAIQAKNLCPLPFDLQFHGDGHRRR
jgi:hypothetical protein